MHNLGWLSVVALVWLGALGMIWWVMPPDEDIPPGGWV